MFFKKDLHGNIWRTVLTLDEKFVKKGEKRWK